MARGRQPWKYKTQQEREEARRERVRLNVRALRQRRKDEEEARRAADEAVTGGLPIAPSAKEKKEFKFVVATAGVKRKRTVRVPADVDVAEPVDDVEEVEELLTNPTRWNDTVALFQRAGKLKSPGVFDVEKHSDYAAIDLQFDALSSVVNHFQAVATDKLPWTTALTENRGKEDRLIEIAISSAGTQYIGTMRKDQKLLDFSSSAYNRTCTSLMARFRDPLWWTQAPSLIIVTNALTIVSMLTSYLEGRSAQTEWTAHYKACNTTMSSAGPTAFQSPYGMTVMRGSRAGVIFINITRGEASFLDHPDWRRLPLLSEITRPRSPFIAAQDAFWDLASRVTTMLARANHLMSILHHSPFAAPIRHDAVTLATELSFLRQEFRAWLFRVEVDVRDRLYSEEVCPPSSAHRSTTSCPEYIFLTSKILTFRDLHAAELITSYWTYSFYLWDISYVYHHTLASLPHPLYLPPEYHFPPPEVDFFASMICQCVWWYMSRQVPTSTLLLYVSFPLRVATAFWARDVRRCGREWDWAVKVAEMVRESGMAGGLAEYFVSGFLPGRWRVPVTAPAGGGGGDGVRGHNDGVAPVATRDRG